MYEHTGTDPRILSGRSLWIRPITDTQDSTGQSPLTPERRWDLFSIFVPFFWSTKQTVTNMAFVLSRGSPWLTVQLFLSLNTTLSVVSLLVRPGRSVRQNSHALIAKKYPPSTRSAACCPQAGKPCAQECISLSKAGVTAFCRFGAGSSRSNPFTSDRTLGCIDPESLTLFGRWKGLARPRCRNDDATLLMASRTVADTMGLVRFVVA
jgi:hypothetical protein